MLGNLLTSPWYFRLTVKFIIKACIRWPSGLSREGTTQRMDLTVSPKGRGLQYASTALLLLLRATAISGEKRLVSTFFRSR